MILTDSRDDGELNAENPKPIVAPQHSSIVLGIVMLGTLMGALDSTIVLLAFPTINDSLHSNLATSLWIILAYLLVLAVATTQMGRIGDIYGRSKIFNLGFVIFTVGSALMRFLTPHLSAHSFQSCSSGWRRHPASNQRSHHCRLFSQRKTRQSIRLQFAGLYGWSIAGYSFRRNNYQLHQLAIHFLHKHSNRRNSHH